MAPRRANSFGDRTAKPNGDRHARRVVAVETQREQAAAAMRRAYVSRQHHHIAAFALWGVALTLSITHFLEHLSLFHVMSSGLQDLLIGWPMAIMLALVGAIVWGRD